MNDPRQAKTIRCCIVRVRETDSLSCLGCFEAIEVPRCVIVDPDRMLEAQEYLERNHRARGCLALAQAVENAKYRTRNVLRFA